MMYFVSVSLSGTDDQYKNFVQTVQTLGNYSNRLKNTWLLECSLTAAQIRDVLRPHLLPGDRIFVGELIQNWAGANMGTEFPAWMSRRQFRAVVPAPAPSAAPAEGTEPG